MTSMHGYVKLFLEITEESGDKIQLELYRVNCNDRGLLSVETHQLDDLEMRLHFPSIKDDPGDKVNAVEINLRGLLMPSEQHGGRKLIVRRINDQPN